MSYATLSELKDSLTIDDTADDPELEIALNAAVDLIDKFCKRHFREIDTNDDSAKTTRVFTPTSARLALIQDAAKVDSVENRQTPTSSYETVDASDYEVRPANAGADDRPFTRLSRVTGWWPEGHDSVRVTAWYGWPKTPKTIKQATIMQASRLVKSAKDAPLGIAPVAGFEGTAVRLMNKLDPNVELLIRPYVRTSAVA